MDPPIERWYVVFATRGVPEAVIQGLPDDMEPTAVFTGREGTDRLSLTRLTVNAYTEREATESAREAMALACSAADWVDIPEIRRVSKA